MKAIPEGMKAYRRTMVWSQVTMPGAIRRAHTTREGTWGLIHVVTGRLRYEILREPVEIFTLSPEVKGVIEPQVPHQVEPIGEVTFFVEFFKAPELAKVQDDPN